MLRKWTAEAECKKQILKFLCESSIARRISINEIAIPTSQTK